MYAINKTEYEDKKQQIYISSEAIWKCSEIVEQPGLMVMHAVTSR